GGQVERQVEPGLPADRRQERVGPFSLDDALEHLHGHGLDVRPVGELRVGHDGRRIRVDEDDAVALFAEGLAGLGARIVELAGLPDNDGPRADQQDRVDVGAAGHVPSARWAWRPWRGGGGAAFSAGPLGPARALPPRVGARGRGLPPPRRRPPPPGADAPSRFRSPPRALPPLPGAREQIVGVVGAGAGLGVVLDRESRLPLDREALDGPVVQVEVGDLGAAAEGFDVDGEAVVLGGDLYLAGGEVLDGLVAAVVAELE